MGLNFRGPTSLKGVDMEDLILKVFIKCNLLLGRN